MRLRLRYNELSETKRDFDLCKPGDEGKMEKMVELCFAALLSHKVSGLSASKAVKAGGAWVTVKGTWKNEFTSAGM